MAGPQENRVITSDDELRLVLDQLLDPRGDEWWNSFYKDRAKPCPFFVEWPDEGLIDQATSGYLPKGRALEFGCGNGRNAVFMARQGLDVVAVDFSRQAIDWATERVRAANVGVELRCESAFETPIEPASFDVIYDSGCFHHLAPHRRVPYVERVCAALKPGGWFGLVCFRPEGGSGFSDLEVYERRSLGGGLGYSESALREIWGSRLTIRTLRQMRKGDPQAGSFGEDFLWTLWAQSAPGG